MSDKGFYVYVGLLVVSVLGVAGVAARMWRRRRETRARRFAAGVTPQPYVDQTPLTPLTPYPPPPPPLASTPPPAESPEPAPQTYTPRPSGLPGAAEPREAPAAPVRRKHAPPEPQEIRPAAPAKPPRVGHFGAHHVSAPRPSGLTEAREAAADAVPAPQPPRPSGLTTPAPPGWGTAGERSAHAEPRHTEPTYPPDPPDQPQTTPPDHHQPQEPGSRLRQPAYLGDHGSDDRGRHRADDPGPPPEWPPYRQ